MKLVFFSFKHRHRYKDLNNFLNSRIYGKYYILNLSGPLKYFIAKLLIFLKIGKTISCDGKPLIIDKSRGINFWMRGTMVNIPETFRNLNNNVVSIYHPLLQNKKIFQLYPINIKKIKIQNHLKIIYISRINTETNIEERNIWEKYKFQIIENFCLIDDKKFSENKTLTYMERGYSKKKIIFNLKTKGVSDENIGEGINNLKTTYVNSELAAALIYAKKKKFLTFKKKEKKFNEIKKKLLQMSQAGFSYDIAKKIINLNDEKEFLDLEKFAKFGDN